MNTGRPEFEHLAWQQERRVAVSGPVGNLALVAFQPVGPELQDVECGVPAVVRREGEEAGVIIGAIGTDDVRVDGRLVDGAAFVERLGADGAPLITWRSLSIDVFSLDGSDYELRIYDANSPALERFAGIECYDYDPALNLVGELSSYDATEQVPWEFTRSSDTGHTKSVPGTLKVTIAGVPHELTVFVDSGQLVLVFSDETTGESYRPGRFLRMPLPGEDGRVEVDFNRSFIPPCGFSDFYSCPIPPAANRIQAPIAAGEKKVLWRSA